ncbi:MAG: ComEA family DNA-binding protein [Planctomycetota bacterium]|jgi:competence ComEA-like helix-hairpin-helix protein
MRAETRQAPGTWLVIGLLATAIGWAAWLRAGRVIVPTAGDGPPPQAIPWPDMQIDLNTASPAELEVLPGIGPRLAERITADRAAHGPFATVDELTRVSGIGDRLVDGIRPFAVADPGRRTRPGAAAD